MNVLPKYIRHLVTSLCVATLISCSDTKEVDSPNINEQSENTQTAIFAGGCFWCMEPPFDKLDGVISTISGYTCGLTDSPNYEQVTYANTGHYEALQVTYDANKIDYKTLLNVFWHNVDPLDPKGQFCDKGDSYRTAIFYQNETEKKLAQQTKQELDRSSHFPQPVVTEILAAKTFYPAEDYHQNYYQTNPVKYKYYRFACGRDKRLNSLWGNVAGIAGSLIPKALTAADQREKLKQEVSK